EILDIEQALSQQGHFCLLDWLLAESFLPYSDYEKWRCGDIATLDKHIKLEKTDLLKLANQVEAFTAALQLQQISEDYYAWSSGQDSLLTASQHKPLNQALTQQWKRHQDLPQMDLFMDNAASIAENALCHGLSVRNFKQAQTQLEKLTALNATHEKLGGYQDLINYGYHMANPAISPQAIATELQALESEVLPLAKTLLKHSARDYLAFAWRRLERNLGDTPFEPNKEKLHRSYVLMQIPDWEALDICLKAENQHYQQTTLLLRSALCSEALKHLHHALLCWCLLMELDPKKAETAIEAKTSNLVWHLWQRFWDTEDSDNMPIEFFPAYIFKQQPGLIHHLDAVPPLQSPATRAFISAIQARQGGGDQIVARKQMQQISPSLLAMYLNA
ncbi:MAG: hypothetical protein KTR17_09760, partial [Cellvibrionaceae bacterium]|nr:hypothetical protein [Cellvibrionaceae bacterium]